MDKGPGRRCKRARAPVEQPAAWRLPALALAASPSAAAAAAAAAALLIPQLGLVFASGSLSIMADMGYTAGDLATFVTAHLAEKTRGMVAGAPRAVQQEMNGGCVNIGPLLAAGVTVTAALSSVH